MDRRLTLRLALLGATCTMFSASLIHAQLPRRLKGCSPPSTLADEIKERTRETATPSAKVHVVRVSFVGVDGLPESAKARVTHRAEKATFDADSDGPLYVAEDARQAMQNYGYFKSMVRSQPHTLRSNPSGEQASVTLYVTEGPQYRLGQIQFAHASVFPLPELRKQIQLRDGDIFDLSKIRAGIDALTKPYDAHGYINFVATPDVHIDGARQSISVVMQLDEGRQFRVGNVQILGLDRQISDHILKLEIKQGMVFSRKLVQDFYKQNKAILPTDASPREDTAITQDARTHMVAIQFDFRGCPQLAR
jgi:outer membrane translocation and assembly module TamA